MQITCKRKTFGTFAKKDMEVWKDIYNGKHNKIAKAAIQRSKSGNEIARYKSIREAERKTGIQNITITRCCKGVYKTAGGYVWEYGLTEKEI